MSLLAGREGFSFQQLSSPLLWEFIYACMSSMTDKIDPRSILQNPSRKQIAGYVHDEGVKNNEQTLRTQYQGEFVTLAFDGGTFKTSNYYVGTIYIPYKVCSPVVIEFEEGVKTKKEMAIVIAETIKRVSKYATVINIVVDGLKHQLDATNLFPKEHENNFQKYLLDYTNALPFLLPDLPHLVQLSLTHARKNKELKLKDYILQIDNIGVEIRKPKAVTIIGSRCPSYPLTRFFYIVPKMLFMKKNKVNIIKHLLRYFSFFFNFIC
jgi:hypothetical protein